MKPSPKRLPAEALAAVVGPLRLLEKKVRPIVAADGRAALALPKKLIADVQAFIEQKRPAAGKALPPLDYFETLDLVSQPSDTLADRLPELLAQVLDPDLAHETGDVLMLACEFLGTAIPRATEETLLGTKNLEPSRIEWGKFMRQWAVANDPLSALTQLLAGQLVDDEVETLAQLYPVLYERGMRGVVVDELAAKAAREDGWLPQHDQRRQLETLLQVSSVDPDFARELQAVNQAARDEGDGGIATRPLQIDVQGLELPAQRLQAR